MANLSLKIREKACFFKHVSMDLNGNLLIGLKLVHYYLECKVLWAKPAIFTILAKYQNYL